MGVSNDGIEYGMMQTAIVQFCGRSIEEAVAALDWYEKPIPYFTSLDELTDCAVRIFTEYWEAHPELHV